MKRPLLGWRGLTTLAMPGIAAAALPRRSGGRAAPNASAMSSDMSLTPRPLFVLALLLPLGLAACTREPATDTSTSPEAVAAPAPSAQATSPRPRLVVHKTPWCGCCTAWAEQAEAAGFAVELRDTEDLNPIKRALGVPAAQASCHTAEVEGYFVEGHVPFDDIRRLLAERPAARGIAVPGMPLGSPGMEADIRQPFTTNLIAQDGSSMIYRHHPGEETEPARH
jgi:hypothetical protein